MSQLQQLVFLDTDILFLAIEDADCRTIINHIANHSRYQLVTSITVLGETLFKTMEYNKGDAFIVSFLSSLKAWDTEIMFPDESVSQLCYCMSKDYEDTRMIGQKTDKVHLAYAMSQGCEFFLTHDDGLIRYKIPDRLAGVNFFKPLTLTPEEFREQYLRR
ncbi:MAG: hypothetical protein PWR25_44 [Euryarchaeota archaeon]|nr:hypothetical protein [Euryarchaeota archaeon]MDN5339579.1 hypothetical protein [Euryarchaeota archaeon]